MLGFEPSGEFVPDHVIDGASKLFNIEFPVEYVDVLRRFSGAHGDVDFRVDRPTPGFDYCGIGLVLSILPWGSRPSVYSVMGTWSEHGLDPNIIPFGEDGGGNYVCFDNRDSGPPKIAFYFHEVFGDDGIIHVCDTFRELLDRLQLPPDDE